ncbi:hypothetical protein IV36_GL001014 [Liquorilactobacillus mali]|uniref:Uncharacterized protein n=1 Tax=Liquorilactobacillus mali TaxID=1618 RepID=A0A0R2FRQ2_9LACO|nr:hypothetical protein IV36_GL001014 [Liquorilactobacillus mali]
MVKKLISGKKSTSLLNFFVERLHTRVLISGTILINVYFPLISVFVMVSPCVLFNSNSGKRLAILIGSPLVDVGFSCLVIFTLLIPSVTRLSQLYARNSLISKYLF